MRDRRRGRATIALVTLAAAFLLSGCMRGPQPLSVEESIWLNVATGSDVYAVPPPSPYYPPYTHVHPYPLPAPALRSYARPLSYAPPEPHPAFAPLVPRPR